MLLKCQIRADCIFLRWLQQYLPFHVITYNIILTFSFQKMQANPLSLSLGGLVFVLTKYGGIDAAWLPSLCHERQCSFCLGILYLRDLNYNMWSLTAMWLPYCVEANHMEKAHVHSLSRISSPWITSARNHIWEWMNLHMILTHNQVIPVLQVFLNSREYSVHPV